MKQIFWMPKMGFTLMCVSRERGRDGGYEASTNDSPEPLNVLCMIIEMQKYYLASSEAWNLADETRLVLAGTEKVFVFELRNDLTFPYRPRLMYTFMRLKSRRELQELPQIAIRRLRR